jgi:exopolysaccharide production repressor protein
MSFVLFLRGLIGVLIVFAIANYAITQSLATTFFNTVLCAILIQLGYFAAILFMVWRSGARSSEPGRQAENASRSERPAAAAKDGKPATETAPLPGVRRSPLP